MKTTTTTISLDGALLEAARAEARRRGMSLSALLSRLVAGKLATSTTTPAGGAVGSAAATAPCEDGSAPPRP